MLSLLMAVAVQTPALADAETSAASGSQAVGDDQPWVPPGGAPSGGPPTDPGLVGLDGLLRLPKSFEQTAPAERAGGADEEIWRGRFSETALRRQEAQDNLDRSMRELEDLAGGSGGYNVTPPGAVSDPTNSPMSFRLRQEIRRHREDLDRAERDQRALEVQADLANVPAEWRQTPPPPQEEAAQVGE